MRFFLHMFISCTYIYTCVSIWTYLQQWHVWQRLY